MYFAVKRERVDEKRRNENIREIIKNTIKHAIQEERGRRGEESF